MNAVEAIRVSLEKGKFMLDGVMDDMKDVPLTKPTPNGGNHPLGATGYDLSAINDVQKR